MSEPEPVAPTLPPRRPANRYRWLTLLAILPCVGGILGYVIALVSSFVQPKRYESVAGVQIHALVQALGPTGEQREFAIGVYETERFLETEIEVIRSHETLKWVVERLGLSTRWGAVQPERVLEILESMVQTEQVPETDLVRITVRHTSAQEVAATICP